MDEEQWTVVGGRNRASKHAHAKHKTPQTASASKTLGAQGETLNAMPGWGCGVDAGHHTTGTRPTKRQNRNRHREETMEERVKRLALLVEECRREVLDSQTYALLCEAMIKAGTQQGTCLASSAEGSLGTHVGPHGASPSPMDTRFMAPYMQPNGEQHAAAGHTSTAQGAAAAASTCTAGPASSAAAISSSACWGQVRQMVVYGLGSLDDSRVSRCQLALGLLLRDLLPGLAGPPLLFDPAFNPADVALLESLGLQVIAENEGGRRLADVPTFFYMPHCEHMLYDALLSANQSAGLLHNICMLGNSLGQYEEAWSCRPRDKPERPHAVLQLVQSGWVLELPVPCGNSSELGAFNNMALHLFRPSQSSS